MRETMETFEVSVLHRILSELSRVPGYPARYPLHEGSGLWCQAVNTPLLTPSSNPTFVLEGDSDFQGNACIPGYEGQYCERIGSTVKQIDIRKESLQLPPPTVQLVMGMAHRGYDTRKEIPTGEGSMGDQGGQRRLWRDSRKMAMTGRGRIRGSGRRQERAEQEQTHFVGNGLIGEAYLVYTNRLYSRSDFNNYVASIYKVLGTFLFGGRCEPVSDRPGQCPGMLVPSKASDLLLVVSSMM
ncbi:hypothetical protein U0070_021388 [Myodes glareolus]|uniref:Uncharacterized protein n=1 Tax=Myodes glareolus TaxID=447135 RepID=A0AAW0HQA9_MYOGA